MASLMNCFALEGGDDEQGWVVGPSIKDLLREKPDKVLLLRVHHVQDEVFKLSGEARLDGERLLRIAYAKTEPLQVINLTAGSATMFTARTHI